jgi:hypothetical protein
VQESWAATETTLRRRYKLTARLIGIAKAHVIRERGTLDAVIQARNVATNNYGTPSQQAQTENVLSRSLRQLFVQTKSYTDLKANQDFGQLQKEIGKTALRKRATLITPTCANSITPLRCPRPIPLRASAPSRAPNTLKSKKLKRAARSK